jgi:hypothetical protein
MWLAIHVHNEGLLPITITSANLTLNTGETVPFVGPPAVLDGGGDTLPKRLKPGEDARFWLDTLQNTAKTHVERGGAKWVAVTLQDGQEFHGEPILKDWLDGWAGGSDIADQAG